MPTPSVACLCLALLFVAWHPHRTVGRSYSSGLIFYELATHTPYLPPTVSVSRGRNLASVKYSSKGSIWSTFGQPCECRGPVCGCCAGLKVDQYKFDQKVCANVTFVPQLEEAQLEVYLNERPSSKYGISVRNPSPFCIPVMMGVPMAMCVQMTDVALVGNNLNMCMDFVLCPATLYLTNHETRSNACMDLGHTLHLLVYRFRS
ncbi:GL19826 [Drosophila persimilis]|uniref:GL19826 n=1 Tax=Drosophila persimilis TaxID=7234 RepID=B4GYC6_DROPE|nr:GL19826 [Drosophila persimilis]